MAKKLLTIIICAYITINGSRLINKANKPAAVNVQLTKLITIENQNITQRDAINIVGKTVGVLPKGFYLTFDHEETLKNKAYYVFHYYESVIDDLQTGEGHSVTYEWFYVDKNNGDIYKLDVISGELIKLTTSAQNKNEAQVLHLIFFLFQ